MSDISPATLAFRSGFSLAQANQKSAGIGSFVGDLAADMTYRPFVGAAKNIGGMASSAFKGDLGGVGRSALGLVGNTAMAGLNAATLIGAAPTLGASLAGRAALTAGVKGVGGAVARKGLLGKATSAAKHTALAGRSLSASARKAMPLSVRRPLMSAANLATGAGKMVWNAPTRVSAASNFQRGLRPLTPLLERSGAGRMAIRAGQGAAKQTDRLRTRAHSSNNVVSRALVGRKYEPSFIGPETTGQLSRRNWANRGLTTGRMGAWMGGASLAEAGRAAPNVAPRSVLPHLDPRGIRETLQSQGLRPSAAQAEALARRFGVPAAQFMW